MRLGATCGMLAILVLTAIAAGCRDATTPRGVYGGVRFIHHVEGRQVARFRAVGLPTFVDEAPQHGTWAVGGWGATSGDMAVMALRERSGTHGELFYLDIREVRGTFTDLPIDGERAYAEVSLNYETATFRSERVCILDSGSISLTQVEAHVLAGTFNGEGVCFDETNREVGGITVTEGSFHVPLAPELSDVLG